MIGLTRRWGLSTGFERDRFAASLGLFAGHRANREDLDGDVSLFCLTSPRARPVRGWQAARSPSGIPVLLSGWIDDCDRLASELSLKGADPAALYGAAVEAFGDKADSRINGSYAALMPMPDGRVRMARSPLGGMPLFYARKADAVAICSVPRPLFAAGVPQVLRHNALLAAVAFEIESDSEATFYEGVSQVPDGSVAWLSRDGVDISQWYDLLALPEVRFDRDEDYVEAANGLLAQAVRNALNDSKNPATTISGGLDSAIVTDEVLRQLPGERRLSAYSFHPLDEWEQKCPPANFVDERPFVQAYAAMHPRLDVHYTDNRGIGFDHLSREFFMACGTVFPAMVLGTTYHGMYKAAAEAGHDTMLIASAGNLGFSNHAPWAWPELLTTGRWSELWRIAANRPDDPRSVLRRIVALAVMPLLPEGLRTRLRRLVHAKKPQIDFRNTLVNEALRAGDQTHVIIQPQVLNRRQWLKSIRPLIGPGAEIVHGYEQVFGIRSRDVTAYRPLLEFCFGLPTDQFVRGGQSRWLARRMAAGRMPEAQRTERRNGLQNMDWHPRLTPRLPQLRPMVERIAAQPELAPYVDSERALALIDNWPVEAPPLGPLENELRFTLPSTLLMSQFVDFVTGRN